MNNDEWTLVKRFEAPPKNGRTAAVDLTYKDLRSGVIFSFSPVIIFEDGNERLTMFMRGDMISDYIQLLEQAAQAAQKIRARWDSAGKRVKLTANLLEHLDSQTKSP